MYLMVQLYTLHVVHPSFSTVIKSIRIYIFRMEKIRMTRIVLNLTKCQEYWYRVSKIENF